MAKQQEDISAQMLANLSRQQYAYGFGGGTIGGDIWNIRQPTSMEMLYGKREPIVELKPEYRGKVNVTPAGRGSAQELRGMREAGGRPYVEAPELYRRGGGTSGQDRSSQFYSTATGRPMGSMMGMGGYGGFGPATNTDQRGWSNYTGDRPIAGINYQNSPVWGRGGTGIPERSGPRNPKYGSNPRKMAQALASQTVPQFPVMADRASLVGFGGYPSFPYSAYS
jgi:hypothetical protein